MTGFDSLDEAITIVHKQQSAPTDLENLRTNLRRSEDKRWRWHWDPAVIRPREPAEAEHAAERVPATARLVSVPTLMLRDNNSSTKSDLPPTVARTRYIDLADAGRLLANGLPAQMTAFLGEVAPR